MTKQILNIEKTPLITSECWTYYKFAIMQTNPVFDEWLATHMKLFVDHSCMSYFGESGRMHPLSYYSDLLSFEEVNIFSINSDEIVDFLIQQINNGTYIVLDLNFNSLLYGGANPTYKVHETLVYGYDLQKKEFYIPLLNNNVFTEMRVSFENIKTAYEDSRHYYKNNPSVIFSRRIWWCGGITLIKHKKQYNAPNLSYDFIYKLSWEKEGNIYTRGKDLNGDKGNGRYVFATGISCLLYLSNFIQEILNGIKNNEYIGKCQKICLKIHENQRILLRSLEWYMNTNKPNDALSELIRLYKEQCNKMDINVRKFYKYNFTQEISILHQIKDDMLEIYSAEKEILTKLVSLCTDIYINSLSCE